jgi:hypothetical protein
MLNDGGLLAVIHGQCELGRSPGQTQHGGHDARKPTSRGDAQKTQSCMKKLLNCSMLREMPHFIAPP